MTAWLTRAGLQLTSHLVLDPPWLKSRKGLTVSLWLAELRAGVKTTSRTTRIATQ
jgi:hypothetical protein